MEVWCKFMVRPVHRATFQPYAKGYPGQRRYANAHLPGPFRTRCTQPWFQRRWLHERKHHWTWRAYRLCQQIDRAARIAAARKWIPCDALTVDRMAMEQARRLFRDV